MMIIDKDIFREAISQYLADDQSQNDDEFTKISRIMYLACSIKHPKFTSNDDPRCRYLYWLKGDICMYCGLNLASEDNYFTHAMEHMKEFKLLAFL